MPPPHKTYDEWVERRDLVEEENRANRAAVARRLQTLHLNGNGSARNGHADNGRGIDAEAVAERLDKFVKMFSLASDPALQGEIISAIKPHEALELAERIEAPDLRNALIRHSLASL
jgi:hypothetical protein